MPFKLVGHQLLHDQQQKYVFQLAMLVNNYVIRFSPKELHHLNTDSILQRKYPHLKPASKQNQAEVL